jgi:hypothetical protein
MVELRAMMLSDLRRRIPALKTRHEDIVQEALADLADRIGDGRRRHPELVGAPRGARRARRSSAPRAAGAHDSAQAGWRICFARGVRGRADEPIEHEPEAIVSRELATDRAMQTAELLRHTAEAMNELSANDREALLLAAERDGERVEGRMPDKDRQRLSRARSRLITLVRARLGDSPLIELLETE